MSHSRLRPTLALIRASATADAMHLVDQNAAWHGFSRTARGRPGKPYGVRASQGKASNVAAGQSMSKQSNVDPCISSAPEGPKL